MWDDRVRRNEPFIPWKSSFWRSPFIKRVRASVLRGGGYHDQVHLAPWDLLGRLRGEPVYHILGGVARDELVFYASIYSYHFARPYTH